MHAHCSAAVGILLGWSFHLRKYGMASTIIQGIARPKYTIYRSVNLAYIPVGWQRVGWHRDTYLVEKETHETCGKNRVAYPEIPGRPLHLEPVELSEICVGIQQTRVVMWKRCHVRHCFLALWRSRRRWVMETRIRVGPLLSGGRKVVCKYPFFVRVVRSSPVLALENPSHHNQVRNLS